MSKTMSRLKLHPESGMTLIELAIAAVVLIVGMLSIMGLLFIAIGNNGRSKIDTSATMLTQAVLEQVSAKLAGGGPGTLTDNANCNGTGTLFTILYQPGGAALNANGTINFTAAKVPNYSMDYVQCNNNVPRPYDVRWNVQIITDKTYLVTVGARPGGGNGAAQFSFALPVTMRSYVGGN
jgi:type II secretory pathway pseudopilin PulG